MLPHPTHSKVHLLFKILSKSSNKAVFWPLCNKMSDFEDSDSVPVAEDRAQSVGRQGLHKPKVDDFRNGQIDDAQLK